jgi:hypothetical protein
MIILGSIFKIVIFESPMSDFKGDKTSQRNNPLSIFSQLMFCDWEKIEIRVRKKQRSNFKNNLCSFIFF